MHSLDQRTNQAVPLLLNPRDYTMSFRRQHPTIVVFCLIIVGPVLSLPAEVGTAGTFPHSTSTSTSPGKDIAPWMFVPTGEHQGVLDRGASRPGDDLRGGQGPGHQGYSQGPDPDRRLSPALGVPDVAGAELQPHGRRGGQDAGQLGDRPERRRHLLRPLDVAQRPDEAAAQDARVSAAGRPPGLHGRGGRRAAAVLHRAAPRDVPGLGPRRPGAHGDGRLAHPLRLDRRRRQVRRARPARSSTSAACC